MRIAVTGATGLLGRNLLFELIKRNLGNLDGLEVLILGRERDGRSIRERITRIIQNDGLSYLGAQGNGHAQRIRDYSQSGVTCLDADLQKPRLGLSQPDFETLKRAPIDFFFHLAAFSDFSDSLRAVRVLRETNVFGTRQVLDLVRSLRVREFCYVGTAYSCGTATGRIPPNYTNLDQPFRNHYESTKLEGEILVHDFEKESSVRCRYFRPSVLSGRLLEAPLGATCKFDAFYAYGAFLYRVKLKLLGRAGGGDLLQLKLRVHTHPESALNIVPVDFVAKVMAEVCLQQVEGSHFHIVNQRDTPFDNSLLPLFLETLGVVGPTCVSRIPNDTNEMEFLYHRSVGQFLAPYMTAHPMTFDAGNLDAVLSRAGIECPDVNDRRHFALLMDYAKQHDFGIRMNAIPRIEPRCPCVSCA